MTREELIREIERTLEDIERLFRRLRGGFEVARLSDRLEIRVIRGSGEVRGDEEKPPRGA